MKSMTGHGRGEAAQDGFKIAVEVGSVNRKQCEISINLSGRGDKDVAQAADKIGLKMPA
jgi:tryptophan synthase beta subunit